MAVLACRNSHTLGVDAVVALKCNLNKPITMPQWDITDFPCPPVHTSKRHTHTHTKTQALCWSSHLKQRVAQGPTRVSISISVCFFLYFGEVRLPYQWRWSGKQKDNNPNKTAQTHMHTHTHTYTTKKEALALRICSTKHTSQHHRHSQPKPNGRSGGAPQTASHETSSPSRTAARSTICEKENKQKDTTPHHVSHHACRRATFAQLLAPAHAHPLRHKEHDDTTGTYPQAQNR